MDVYMYMCIYVCKYFRSTLSSKEYAYNLLGGVWRRTLLVMCMYVCISMRAACCMSVVFRMTSIGKHKASVIYIYIYCLTTQYIWHTLLFEKTIALYMTFLSVESEIFSSDVVWLLKEYSYNKNLLYKCFRANMVYVHVSLCMYVTCLFSGCTSTTHCVVRHNIFSCQ